MILCKRVRVDYNLFCINIIFDSALFESHQKLGKESIDNTTYIG